MFPPEVADNLVAEGHEATTPAGLGAQTLPDSVLIQIATEEQRVIVTENASDFAKVTTCPVLLVRKAWWSRGALTTALSRSASRWAAANPDPGPWAHWLPADLR